MKKLIVTMNTQSYQPLADITLPSKLAYAQRHGFQVNSILYDGPDSKIGWTRFGIVANALEEFDEVFWLDADAMIMNPNISTEDRPGHLAIASDLHGLNTGVFIARRCDLVRQLFYVINGNYGAQHFGGHLWGEQAALIHLLSMPPYRDLPTYYHQRELNSYLNDMHAWPDFVQGNYENGDFVLQLAGMPLPVRIDMAARYAPPV